MLQSRFSAVLRTEEWLALLETGGKPETSAIFDSNQRARMQLSGEP